MPRRGDADPLLLQAVSERLARLLAETPPRRAVEEAEVVPAAEPAALTPGSWLDTELVEVEDVPPPRRFHRRHLVVVCVLLLVGLLWAGWSMLRAQPVALASPMAAPTSVLASASVSPPLPASASPSSSSSATGAAGRSGPSGSPAAPLVVHVLGAVRTPGLVSLGERARVQDAIDAAGGFSRNADPGDLNLAQLLQDGQQVVIGTTARPAGEVRGSSAGSGGSGSSGAGSGSAGAGGAGSGGAASGGAAAVLDLNNVTEAQLEELPGVGPVTAGKIAAWRTEHGRFSRVEELQEVDGIGPKTYAEIAPHVRV